MRVQIQPEQPFSPKNVADPADHLLVHQHGPYAASGLGSDVVKALWVGIVTQWVRTDGINDVLGFCDGERPTNCRAHQIRPRVPPDDPDPCGGPRLRQLDSAAGMVFLFPDLARRPAGRVLLAAKGRGTIHAEMHIEHQVVIELQNPVLSVGLGSYGAVTVEQCGAGNKTTLWRGQPELLGDEDVVKMPGNPVDGVTFRH